MNFEEPGSVTHHIVALKAGDPDAVHRLWDRYFPRLVRLARLTFRARGDRRLTVAEGSEDAASRAFQRLCTAVAEEDALALSDRDDLWIVLVRMTRDQAIDILRRELAAKRGGGRVVAESVLAEGEVGFAEFVGCIRTPEEEVIGAEAYQRHLDRLGDETLRRVALLRMEGYTNGEIAQQLGRSLSYVNRKLDLIRALWTEERPWAPP
jgi:DNA-directed RNA polymerase specialized sigma24 family protein